MQNSPNEIKSRLDRAVDVDGNVLDMAAVLEAVTVLEQFPLTKEALEKTRIGKTINLLRKKTNNKELARRAKKLVKRWQELVINQMGRNADSPVHSNRSSPVINGTLKDGKKPDTLTDNKSAVCKVKKKGIKRKCESSSSENSPVTFAKLSDDSSSRPCTPLLVGDQQKDSSPRETLDAAQTADIPKAAGMNFVDSGCTVTTCTTGHSSSVVDSSKGANCVASSEGVQEHTVKSDESLSSVSADTRTESQITAQSLDSRTESLQDEVETTSAVTDTQEQSNAVVVTSEKIPDTKDLSASQNIACRSDVDDHSNVKSAVEVKEDYCPDKSIEENMENAQESCDSHVEPPPCGSSSVAASLQSPDTKQCDQNDVSLSGSSENMCISDDGPKSPREPVLDLDARAIGINGRYGDDGEWYDWSQVMPISDGALNILPYVILE